MPDSLDISKAHVSADWTHDRPLTCCRFDPQGRYVFTGGEEANVQRFAIADGAKTTFSGGHVTWVMSLAFAAEGENVISAGADGRLVWWETVGAEPKPIRTVEAHKGWIRSLASSPDGKLLASGGNDHVVRLWNADDGTLVRELAAHESHIYCIEFHPREGFLLSGDLKGRLIQWKLDDGSIVREFEAKELHSYNGGQQVDFGGIRGIAVSPDNKAVAAGGLYKSSNPLGAVHEPLVQLFNWETKELLKNQIAEGITQGVIWRLQYLADGTLMGVNGGGSGGHLLFWKADSEKDVSRYQLPALARDMDLHPDGLQVVTAHYDRHVRISRLAAKTEAAG